MKKRVFHGYFLLLVFLKFSFLFNAPVRADSLLDLENYGWKSLHGPWAANVTSICVHPSSPNNILIGTNAGFFFSVNGGASWIPNQSDINPINISHIRVHPTNPDVYIATGIDSTVYFTGSIFKSFDKGQSWIEMVVHANMKDVVIDPDNPSRYLGASEAGILLSTDEGVTWTASLPSVHAYEIAAIPDEPGHFATVISEAAIAYSSDSGITWEKRGESFENAISRSISICSDELKTIFVSWRFNDKGEIATSTDKGLTWNVVLEEPINRVRTYKNDVSKVWAVGGYTNDLKMSVFVSYDTGDNWQRRSENYLGLAYDIAIHPDDPATAFLGKINSGILMTTDDGLDWFSRNRNLSGGTVVELELEQLEESSIIMGCSTISHPFLTDHLGVDWSELNLFGSYTQSGAFKPDDSNLLLVGGTSMNRSTDGGKTWLDPSIVGGGLINTIHFSEYHPDIVVAGVYNMSDTAGIWISYNAGGWWSRITTDYIGCTAIDPFDPSIIYGDFYQMAIHELRRSTNSGTTWEKLSEPAFFLIKTDPLVEGRLYTRSYVGNLNRSDDFGSTWIIGLGANVPGDISDLAVSSVDSSIYAAASGFFYSLDAGETWMEQSRGLPETELLHVAVRSEEGIEQYYAGTLNYGAYKWAIQDMETPTINLISPDGGEVFTEANFVKISWLADDNISVFYCDIFLSTDSGVTFPYVVAGGHTQQNKFFGYLPSVSSGNCRIKIVTYDTSYNQAEDVSSEDFTINISTPTPGISTATPTPVPTYQNTSTPTPTPVKECGDITLSLEMKAYHYQPGDRFYLKANLCNPDDSIPWVAVFIILDYHGQFFFAPSWSDGADEAYFYDISLPAGVFSLSVIPEFQWPSGAGSDQHIRFWGLIAQPDLSNILSNIDLWDFSYSE